MQSSRIESLDYLRGLMAFSVMIYHYGNWSGLPFESDTIFGRLGIYAVSIFYILSGLSLSLAYRYRINDLKDFRDFSIKRAARIIPLFWLATSMQVFLSYVIPYFTGGSPSENYGLLVLNYTLLFGIYDPSLSLITGGWSIGNETFFYLIFPFVIFFSARNKWAIAAFIALSAAFAIYYSYFALTAERTLAEQWQVYVKSLNQIFLFAVGVAIGHYKEQVTSILKRKSLSLALAALCISVFILPIASGDQINIVTGNERLLLSLACFGLVISTLTLNPGYENAVTRPLKMLGEISYTIYLMHPLVWIATRFIGQRMDLPIALIGAISIILTLASSVVIFNIFEKFFIKRGTLLIKQLNSRRQVPALDAR